MTPESLIEQLENAWTPARRAGVLGSVSVAELWRRAEVLASVLSERLEVDCFTWNGRVIDVGTGAGVPGLLVALQMPQVSVDLVDSSSRRLVHAEGALAALALGDRCRTVHGRGDELGHDPAYRHRYDVAVSWLLGGPSESLEQLAPLVSAGGVVIVSASEADRPRWLGSDLSSLGCGPARVHESPLGLFVSVEVRTVTPSRFPRRPKARTRSPLL